jgi:hypothetical protein
VALGHQFSFQRSFHFVEIGLYWEKETYLNPQVFDAFALGDPFETDFLSPTPCSFSPARPDGGGFIPVDLGARCLAKGFQHSMGLVQVCLFTFEIQSYIVSKRLVPDSAPSWQSQTFDGVPGVFQHVPQNVDSYDEEVGR